MCDKTFLYHRSLSHFHSLEKNWGTFSISSLIVVYGKLRKIRGEVKTFMCVSFLSNLHLNYWFLHPKLVKNEYSKNSRKSRLFDAFFMSQCSKDFLTKSNTMIKSEALELFFTLFPSIGPLRWVLIFSSESTQCSIKASIEQFCKNSSRGTTPKSRELMQSEESRVKKQEEE